MKKIFITLLVLFSISSFAQNHFVGVQVGLNTSNVFGTDYTNDFTNLNSFSAGLTYDYKLKHNFLLGSGLLYDCRGSIVEATYIDEEGNSLGVIIVKSRLGYLSLPLKVGYQIGKKWSGYVYFGLVPSYLLKAENIFPKWTTSGISDEKEVTDMTSYMNRFDLSAILELGSNYQVNNKFTLFVSGSYLRGFTEVHKNSGTPFAKYYRLNISLGLKYALKSE